MFEFQCCSMCYGGGIVLEERSVVWRALSHVIPWVMPFRIIDCPQCSGDGWRRFSRVGSIFG